ncbi:MAG: ATP-binding protein, partial [Pseudomonadales bacterium]|nr:ATP-binding protein [Pseudomonadales bacterium]
LLLFEKSKSNIAVKADRTRLRQVLSNLISNAIKYNEKSGKVKVRLLELDSEKIRITVEDTGIGIEASRANDIFEPFNRAGAEKTSIDGAGIGLAVTKKLIEAMNGAVGFQSIAGKGSVFWVELPAFNGSERNHCKPDTTNTQIRELNGDILYVEDNESNAYLMKAVVAQHPLLKLDISETAEEGLQKAFRGNYKLVLMDINLPGINGIEALKELRDNADTQQIPVIAISAAAAQCDIDACLAKGFDGYITKPVELAQVIDVLARYCS